MVVAEGTKGVDWGAGVGKGEPTALRFAINSDSLSAPWGWSGGIRWRMVKAAVEDGRELGRVKLAKEALQGGLVRGDALGKTEGT